MQAHGIPPDVITYSSLVDVLCKSARLDAAVAILKDMEDKGIKPTIVIYSILMNSLCESGQLEDAANLFYDLVLKGLQPNVKTYNGLMNEVDKVLRNMEEDGCSPDDITYNTIIRRYILNNDLSKALWYCDLMVNKGFEADANTFHLLTSCHLIAYVIHLKTYFGSSLSNLKIMWQSLGCGEFKSCASECLI
ncbi:putative pentatricopeptide repeat-containing protein At1g12700, mitochondrial [Spinacia oleracea]|uniref:Pentatricopeptide repeat-containing protein At1g12700, mitochondrial n=1 Tax=Spinacia oleracea TaxID=3562 RepID=A0A9R0JIV8_SPIOL|nr:putative pentatricopeptide repeat-containing protein At1g12700, mitochondrial [Spinacia oleracea]XP_056699450.1 putative pentatricopeptide repeat-containing protein At1g12700, mitochondrial [Spinacia oleracea]